MTTGGLLRKDRKSKTTRKKSVHFKDRDGSQAKGKLAPLKKAPKAATPVSLAYPTRLSPARQEDDNLQDPGSNRSSLREGSTGVPSNVNEIPLMRASPTRRERAADIANLFMSKSSDSVHRRRSTISLFSSREVSNVLSGVAEAQKIRQQEQIDTKLRLIQKRVRKILENVGLESDEDEDEEDDERIGQVRLPPIFDSRAERDRMKERNYMVGKLDKFEEKAVLRKQYLTELNFWFKENENLAADVVTPEEMKAMIQDAQETHQNITKSLIKFVTNGDRVVDTGRKLLTETSKIISERHAQMAKRTKKERIIVYDDKTLLSDPIKWESSVRMVVSVMEDCQKMIKNMMFKNALKLSQRQFDYLMVASDKRYKDLDEKKKQCLDLQGKLHAAKTLTEKVNKELDEQRRKMSKMSTELAESKDSLEKLKNRNMELNVKIKELKAKIKLLEEQLMEKLRTPTPPPPPPPPTPPEPEKIFIKVVDSFTELRLQEVERELQMVKDELEKHLANIHALNEKLTSEKEKNQFLQDRIIELERVPDPIMPAPSPAVLLEVAAPVAEVPQDKEASYYKTLMAGIKNEYEAELEKVKTFVKKEKSRGEAGLRKLEIQHKDHLGTIHKDTIRILRAIVHMRDHMLNCLQKENLTDQAQALCQMGNLVKDKLNPEPKELLTTVVGAVVDYLHNMETILNNAFLALRMFMKSQMDRLVESEVQTRLTRERHLTENKKVVKDCVKKTKDISGAKQEVKGLAKRLKTAKNKLKKYNKDMELFSGDQRYNELLSRYGQVIRMYKNMQKEMDSLQSEFHDTMQRKLDEKETMVVTKMRMEMKQQRLVKEEQLKLSIIDQKENLRLLTRAYEDNKISRDLHLLASTMIQKTMEIPQRKLQNLFEQYITFRTVGESKRRVQEVLEDEESDLAIDTRRDMEVYLQQLDGKVNNSMEAWRHKMKELDLEKKEMNKNIYKLFNELLLETGILLVHPLLRDTNTRNILTRAATTVSRQQVKSILERRKNRFKGLMEMPDIIHGNSLNVNDAVMKKWLPTKTPPAEPKPGVVAPHMLVYEINKPSMAASRSLSRRRKTVVSLGKTESFNIGAYNHLEFLRDGPRLV